MDRNEGIYVRDTKTGHVKAIVGETYMLSENEELWEKHLRPEIQTMLDDNKDPSANRNQYRYALVLLANFELLENRMFCRPKFLAVRKYGEI